LSSSIGASFSANPGREGIDRVGPRRLYHLAVGEAVRHGGTGADRRAARVKAALRRPNDRP